MPLAGQTAKASDVTTIDSTLVACRPSAIQDTNSRTTTSTSYTSLSTTAVNTYTVPPSGMVKIYLYTRFNTSANMGWLGFEIRDTNVGGTVLVAASDNQAHTTNDTFASGEGREMTVPIVSGLTPGGTIYVRPLGRVTTSGTVTYSTIRLTIEGVY